MNEQQAELFQEEVLRALRNNPKTVTQIYRILKQKYPKYCNDTRRHFGTRLKWKHDVSNLLNKMQKEFLIYLDPSAKKWKIAE